MRSMVEGLGARDAAEYLSNAIRDDLPNRRRIARQAPPPRKRGPPPRSGEEQDYPTVCSITPKIGWRLSSSAQIRTVSPFFRKGVTGAPPWIVSTVRTSAMQE